MGAGVHVDDLRLRGIDGAVPADAERLVEGDVVGGDGDTALDQRVLGRIERALRIKHFEKAGGAVLVEGARQESGTAVGGAARSQRLEGQAIPRPGADGNPDTT